MTKYLVTGGAGFVGSHLCERLAQDKNNTVVSLDNYFTGSITNHVDGVRYITGSTEDIDNLVDFNPDVVYHLGEYSRVEQSFADLDLVLKYNVAGTSAVLRFVRRTRAKLIYAGSSTKFADTSGGYVQSPYAWSKANNTELVQQFAKWTNIDYAITYFYNVYGKREISCGDYATLIAKYAKRMQLGMSLPVVSPGSQERNFTHIDDIVDALILIGENGHGDEYGIGNHQAYSVVEVANLFGGEIELLPARPGNRMSAPVITAKTQLLGWQPRRKLENYISSLKQNGWLNV